MPLAPFNSLPDDSRVWIFGSDRRLEPAAEQRLLEETDRFLSTWAAHGSPLTCGREWKESRFLTIAADQSTAGASGCSIDVLFRVFKTLGPALGADLVGSGRIYYRDADGRIAQATRDEFAELAASGKITAKTPVFDTTVQTLGEWRSHFERPLADSWHAQLLPEGASR